MIDQLEIQMNRNRKEIEMFTKLSPECKKLLDELIGFAINGHVKSLPALSSPQENTLRQARLKKLNEEGYISWHMDGSFELQDKALTYSEEEAAYDSQVIERNTTYKFDNIQAERIYVNSIDNSTNIDINSETNNLFNDIIRIINENGLDSNSDIVFAVSEMQQSIGKPSFKDNYIMFIQSIANHMTIFAPFIPALTQYL